MSRTAALSPLRVGIVGGLMVAIGPVTLSVYTPGLPLIATALEASSQWVKLTVTAFFVGMAGAQLLCGPFSDAFGRRPAVFTFLALYVAATLLCAAAPTVELLVVGRLLQGIGAAFGLSVARAIVRDRFTGQPAAQLYNLIALMLAVGPAISPTLGAVILDLAGWREIFFAMLAYAILLGILFAVAIPETLARPDPRALHPAVLWRNLSTVAADPIFLRPALMISMSIGGLFTTVTVLPFVLLEEFGMSPYGYAVVLLFQTGAYVAATLATTVLLRRIVAERLLVFGIGLLAIAGAGILLALSRETVPLAIAMVPYMLWMAAIALIVPGASAAALAPFPAIAGTASALLGFFQFMGGIVGSGLSALFADPVDALAVVLPGLAAVAVLAYILPVGRGTAPTGPQAIGSDVPGPLPLAPDAVEGIAVSDRDATRGD